MTTMEKSTVCREIIQEILSEERRPMCRLQFSQEPFGIADSHLGGIPYVPHDKAIPASKDGYQLWLCAQINFAQMPPLPDFPRKGILQIFLSDMGLDDNFGFGNYGESQENWRAVDYPEVDERVTEAECLAKMVIPWEEAI